MPPSIGLFGGTFDPPHIGHLILAAEAQAQFGLERLLWILTPDPPHKKNQAITPLEHRVAMVRDALADNPVFELSRIEMDRPGPHYALDTVNLIARQNQDAALVYIMGGDSLRDLPLWHKPGEFIAGLDILAVMHRPGDSIDLPVMEKIIPGLTAKIRFVDGPQLDISAHEIRMRIAAGRPFRYFLSTKVYNYIVKKGLYR